MSRQSLMRRTTDLVQNSLAMSDGQESYDDKRYYDGLSRIGVSTKCDPHDFSPKVFKCEGETCLLRGKCLPYSAVYPCQLPDGTLSYCRDCWNKGRTEPIRRREFSAMCRGNEFRNRLVSRHPLTSICNRMRKEVSASDNLNVDLLVWDMRKEIAARGSLDISQLPYVYVDPISSYLSRMKEMNTKSCETYRDDIASSLNMCRSITGGPSMPGALMLIYMCEKCRFVPIDDFCWYVMYGKAGSENWWCMMEILPKNYHFEPSNLVVWVDVSPFPFRGIFRFQQHPLEGPRLDS